MPRVSQHHICWKVFSIGVVIVVLISNTILPQSTLSVQTSHFDIKQNYDGVPHVPASREIPNSRARHLSTSKEIKVPADMWRRPSEIPSWNPVPLPNCCPPPGERDTSIDWLFPDFCDTLEDDAIRYYGPGMGRTPEDLRNVISATGSDIVFVGDSLSKQWFKTLYCYLGGSGIIDDMYDKLLEADIKESFYRFKPSWRGQKRMNMKGTNIFDVYRSPMNKEGKTSTQSIHHIGLSIEWADFNTFLDYYNERYPHDFSRPRPIFIINKGMHFNLMGQKSRNANALKKKLDKLVHYCRNTGSKCIFRETTPQHFASDAGDGLWPGFDKAKKHCLPTPPASFQTLSRWRNNILYEAIEESTELKGNVNDGGFLEVMPIFDKLVGLDENSHKMKTDTSDDCTHFRWEQNIWEPWHISLTEVLLKILKENF